MINKLRELIKEVVAIGGWDLRTPDRPEFGHYSTNTAFLVAKIEGKPLPEVADRLAKKIAQRGGAFFDKVEVTSGCINFWISAKGLQKELEKVFVMKEKYGRSAVGKDKTVIVEYSQPNIAKRMHVGHLRSTIIGDALANVFAFCGYRVIRWNYLGDWGTQFGKLIAAYKLWGKESEVKKNPIGTLVDLYVKFHDEIEKDSSLEDKGREEFKKLEEGDAENRKLWAWFKEESLAEFKKIYDLLGVRFDVAKGESVYEKDMTPLVEELLKSSVAKKSEGAVIISLDDFELPPALIEKEDGASLYLTRDIASLRARIKEFAPEKILYVVSNEQTLHFEQLFAVAKILGLDVFGLHHIKFGLMRGEDKKKFSTREGKGVPLQELLDKVIFHAREIVEAKNTDLGVEEKERVARIVGVGALKYNDLKENRNSDVIFDWKKMLDLRGDSGPYLQYTYARLRSILRKSDGYENVDFKALSDEIEKNLMVKIFNFSEVIEECAKTLFTNVIALYLYELASMANNFYQTVPILKDENVERRNARLGLIDVVSQVLKNGLGILGVEVLEEI